MEAEVARLKTLLADAGVDMGKGGAVVPHRMTAQEPRAHQNTPRSRTREARQLRKSLETTQVQKDTIKALRYEVRDLRKAVKEAETQKGTIRALSGMIEHLRARLGDFQDQKDRVRVLSWQVDTLRLDLDGLRASLKKSEDEKKSLSQALSGAGADHRKALRRSRRLPQAPQKAPSRSRSRPTQPALCRRPRAIARPRGPARHPLARQRRPDPLGAAAFLPPSDDPGRWLFNLEELPSAVPLVQAALYQLVLDRKVGEYELPEGASLIACGIRWAAARTQ